MGRGDAERDLVNATELAYALLFAAADPESGVATAQWCLGPFPGSCDHLSYEPIDFRLQRADASLAGLHDAVTYYATLLVENGAGALSYLVSDGFTVDVSGPEC